jgi:nucleoside-diphosphate-sugar epimerase
MNVLLTGGAGYIGSTLCEFLLKENYKVKVVDTFNYGFDSLNSYMHNPNFSVEKVDVRNFEKIKQLLKKQDVIIPLAALVGAPLCNFKPKEAEEINFNSIQNIINSISKDQMLIYPTTNSGYGVSENQQFCTEDSPLNPISIYGVTKVKAEEVVKEFESHISFRLATVFGCSPRMRLDLLVNDFVYKSIFDKYVVLFEGHFKRNYIHIRDVCGAMVFAIKNFNNLKNQTFNLGLSTANLSKLELCEEIKKINKEFTIISSEFGKDIDKRNYIVSNEKIEKAGFKTKYTLQDGIKELSNFFKIFLPNEKMRNF